MRSASVFLSLLMVSAVAVAQWQMQTSGTKASLRGIYSVPSTNGGDSGIAWASGTEGTVLRTLDGGQYWQTCATPPGAAALDFRGIQAWDRNTAIVMSSGPGNQSRLYKTTDGCNSWNLLFTNPDKDGFWDAIKFVDRSYGLFSTPYSGVIVGDSVRGHWSVFVTFGGQNWLRDDGSMLRTNPGEGSFAASNSALILFGSRRFLLATNTPEQSRVVASQSLAQYRDGGKPESNVYALVPMAHGTASAGIFSMAAASLSKVVAVGGDYLKPDERAGTASFTLDGGKTWQAAETAPGGYRSAVAYDEAAKAYLAVGPNGTDISADDGRNWRPLRPRTNDATDADRKWNALSLPFVVGPDGRIGKLESSALHSPE